MDAGAADIAPLKEIQKLLWSNGDFAELAREVMPTAEVLVAAAGVLEGDRVLDVAAGTGNVAAAAALRGARVTASDITPAMVEAGAARCAAEGLDVDWVEADAEALPFEDGAFDAALSSFGAMFAPRPEVAAAELLRVVRPGGRAAMLTWAPDSYPARILTTVRSFMPTPPVPVPDPIDWGREDVARGRFASAGAASVAVERRVVAMTHATEEEMLAFQERNLGPLVVARMALGDRFAELEEQARAVISDMNAATDGSCRVESGYLVVVADRPGA